jgi:hypothetical protein
MPRADDVTERGELLISEAKCRAFGSGDPHLGRREIRNMLSNIRDRTLHPRETAKPASVRWAEPKDEDACVELWKLDIAESAAHIALLDEDKLRDEIRKGTERKFGYVGIIDGENGPVALSVLVSDQWFWSNAWYVRDLTTFVHPDHRKSRHIYDLLDFNEWVVDEMTRLSGYRTYLLTGVLSTHRLWAKTALFRRRYQQVGGMFAYPPPAGVA